VLNDLVSPLVQETVNVVVVGSFFIYGKMIYRVRSLENAVCKAVREIKRGESPYFRGLLDVIGCVVLVETEELQSVLIVSETDNIRADFIRYESLIAACLQANAGKSVEIYHLC